jgi:hypothetical protein
MAQDRLLSQLNQSQTTANDKPLWQVIKQLISLIRDLQNSLSSTSSSTESSAADYVVMSDGVTPIPSPVNDGFGNFIYIEYTP